MSSGGPGCCRAPDTLPMQPPAGCVVARVVAHLPDAKQRQLCAIMRIIRATADVERVVLFGSHARGDWVNDPVGGYISDFDVAVLVRDPALAADEALWADCQERAREVAGDTPVSLIAHTVDDVRQQLARGSSFFRDVMSEGIALYDAGRAAIAVPELTPAQRLELAQVSFTRYFKHAAQLYRSFERNLVHGSHAIAAFELHQVAETIYKAVLLVFTAYQPKLHDLDEFGRRCARVAPDIGPLVPSDAPDRKRLAGLLCAAYVDARYSFGFDVSRADLDALARYVGAFRARLPGAACRAGCHCNDRDCHKDACWTVDVWSGRIRAEAPGVDVSALKGRRKYHTSKEPEVSIVGNSLHVNLLTSYRNRLSTRDNSY